MMYTSRLLPCLLLTLGLTGCASWLGAGDTGESPVIYAPDPRITPAPDWPQSDGSLLIAIPNATQMLEGHRILVRPKPDEIQVLRGARWLRPPPEMLQDALLHTLEDSGKLRSVARQGSGIAADWTLALDLRRFEADYSRDSSPTVEIALTAKLIARQGQRIIASRTFTHSEATARSSTEAVMTAFTHGLEQVSRQLAHWVLASSTDDSEKSRLPSGDGI